MQPPSGGCVLKPQIYRKNLTLHLQPPSGGCVLKPQVAGLSLEKQQAAAFGRLCVETIESFCTADKIERSRLRAAVC